MMVLMVVAQDKFRDEEYLIPKAILENAGNQVITGSQKTGSAYGKLGTIAEVDIAISGVDVKDYDAVVFVGGPGARGYFGDETALNLVREAYRKGRVVGSICSAGGILAHAGILKGKKATAFSGEANILKENDADYLGLPVVVDGRIITANGPEAAEEFGKVLVEAIKR